MLTATLLVASACQWNPGQASEGPLRTCENQVGTIGIGWSQAADPPSGTTYVGTEGDDVVIISSGPVTFDGRGGDDLICVADSGLDSGGGPVVIDAGDGDDTIVNNANLPLVVDGGDGVDLCVNTSGATNCDYEPINCDVVLLGATASITWTADAALDHTSFQVRRSVNGGAFETLQNLGAAATFTGDVMPADAGSVVYRLAALGGARTWPALGQCVPSGSAVDGIASVDPNTGEVIPVSISQSEMLSTGYQDQYRCDTIRPGYTIASWPTDLDPLVLHSADGPRMNWRLAFPLGPPPAGHSQRVRVSVGIEREIPGRLPVNESGYRVELYDDYPRRHGNTAGYLDGPLPTSTGVTHYGNVTNQGWWFRSGGYLYLNLDSYFSAFSGSAMKFTVKAYLHDNANPSTTPSDSGVNDLPQIAPDQSCLLTLPPDHPARGPIAPTIVPGAQIWADIAGMSLEVTLFVAEGALSFVPGAACASAILGGNRMLDSIACVDDLVGSGHVSTAFAATELLVESGDAVLTFYNRYENFVEGEIFGVQTS